MERLVVVGGDGTLNEVLNGLADPGHTPLLQLPAGTANVLAHELGFPREPVGTVAVLEQGRVRHIDMGVADGRRFLLMVGAGFDAEVIREIQSGRTGKLGYRGYVKPVLKVLEGYSPPDLEVRIDDGEPLRCEALVASNTRNYGGLFRLAGEARCDSGQLDVVLFERASIPHLLRFGLEALLADIAQDRRVGYLHATKLWIDSPDPVPLQLDGEYFGTTPVEIELRPRVVPVVVPADAPPD